MGKLSISRGGSKLCSDMSRLAAAAITTDSLKPTPTTCRLGNGYRVTYSVQHVDNAKTMLS
jgi:hypothetical protein